MAKKRFPSFLFRVCTFHRVSGMKEWLMNRADKDTMKLAARWAHVAQFGFPPESYGPVRHYPERTAR